MKIVLVLFVLLLASSENCRGFNPFGGSSVQKAVASSGSSSSAVQGSSDLLSVPDSTDDSNFFELLYSKLSDVMSPGSASSNGRPSELFLMEVPGLAIAREDFDVDVWQAQNYRRRQPAAVFASLVDRVPRYNDVSFVDSGASISSMWQQLMRQYLVPTLQSEEQVTRAKEARERLDNGTLSEDFFAALEDYEDALEQSFSARAQCLATYTSSPEICSQRLLVEQLRVRSRWFDMETRRRELESAQATVLALQVADLKVIFADALEGFERSRRVDVGAESYGSTFMQTYATPSNWWQWWPLTAADYDVVLPAGQTQMTVLWADIADNDELVALLDGAAALDEQPELVRAPTNGELLQFNETAFTYVPDVGFAGADSFTMAPNNSSSLALEIVIGVTGPVVSAASQAFVRVSMSSSESSSSSSSGYSYLSVSARARVSYGFFSASSSSSFSSSSYGTSFTSSTSSSSVQFEIAKVSIARPWLDPTLLAYKPVAIRGLTPGAWSDGRGLPSTDTSPLFPLLPTSFIVARNIELSSDSWGSMSEQLSQATAARDRSSFGIQLGPFFVGSSAISGRYDSSRTQTSATYDDSGSLIIDGPQIIGWTAIPLPFFPTASSSLIEQLELGKQVTTES